MGIWAHIDFVLAIPNELMGFWAFFDFALGTELMGFWVHLILYLLH